MSPTDLDVVTGAFGNTGRFIARRLLDAGRQVRTLTHRPEVADPLAAEVSPVPYRFDDPDALADSLRGAETLYNTYWVRMSRGSAQEDAVAHSRSLFEAAARAGVERIVHISVMHPSLTSPYPYFRRKAQVEAALAASGVSHAIVRPALVFGPENVLVDNIAWLLRHVPVFAVAGNGRYPVRPVHVDDVARICVDLGGTRETLVIDAGGPDTLTFDELVGAIKRAVASRARIVHVPLAAVELTGRGLGLVLRDVLATGEELRSAVDGLASFEGPSPSETSFLAWVAAHGHELGRTYRRQGRYPRRQRR